MFLSFMFSLNGLALKVFNDRYALRDANGNQIEKTPEEMWKRVADFAAQNEKSENRDFWAEKFYSILENFHFVPGGRILSGAGTGTKVTFYNCYVIPSPEDSRGGILESVKIMSEMMSRGGGVGVNISTLRPKGSYVKGVNGTASGPVSFAGLYSYATGLIIQGGSRRGALMLMMDDSHPDIEEFITAKQQAGVLSNANLSVCISDNFMEAVENDADWNLIWNNEIRKTIKARHLWDLICQSAWESGEPGVVFIDHYNALSNTWYFEKIISVNPCGEQGLGPWGVCNLGSLNLVSFVENSDINWEKLKNAVQCAVRFLDDNIDLTEYFFEENRQTQMNIRRIGLGTMGLADLLIKLKIRYGSNECLELCRRIFSFIRDKAYEASTELSRERGAFPKFDKEKYLQGKFIQSLPSHIQESIAQFGTRNAVLLTQAPTGTTSILAGVSSGIEPIYDFILTRKDRIGENEVRHPAYEEFQQKHPNESLPDYFVTAKELTPEEHVKVQAIVQEYIDSSISKTVNAPENHTVDDVKRLYDLAYKLGCKGITYFREGSRQDAVLTSKTAPEVRPEIVAGKTYKLKIGYGTLYITVNNDNRGKPFEVFATIGKTGGFFAAKSEAICRLVSLALRSGIAPEIIIEQLRGIRGPMPSWTKYGQVFSIPDAISHILAEHAGINQSKLDLQYKNEAEEAASLKNVEVQISMPCPELANNGFAPECPECGTVLEISEGCLLCRGCGFSKCG